jgi:hypothetical protein
LFRAIEVESNPTKSKTPGSELGVFVGAIGAIVTTAFARRESPVATQRGWSNP